MVPSELRFEFFIFGESAFDTWEDLKLPVKNSVQEETTDGK